MFNYMNYNTKIEYGKIIENIKSLLLVNSNNNLSTNPKINSIITSINNFINEIDKIIQIAKNKREKN